MNDVKPEVETQASENQEETTEETTDESESTEEESQDVDYKEELEALQARLEGKEKQLEQAEFTIEKIKKDRKGSSQDDIQKLIEQEIAKRFDSVEKTALQSSAEQLAQSVARNDDEAKLILFHYKNSIISSGDLRSDIENAQILANRKRIQGELEELKRSMSAPKAKSAGGSGTKKSSVEVPKLSPKEASFIQSAGMKWNPKNNRYEGTRVALEYNHDTQSWKSVQLSS